MYTPFECFFSSPPVPFYVLANPRMGVLELGLADSHTI